jgi:hypothetical protein
VDCPEPIEYEVTLLISVPSGRGTSAPSPIFEDYYRECPDLLNVRVTKARRTGPGTNYGGPAS